MFAKHNACDVIISSPLIAIIITFRKFNAWKIILIFLYCRIVFVIVYNIILRVSLDISDVSIHNIILTLRMVTSIMCGLTVPVPIVVINIDQKNNILDIKL